MHSSTLLKLIGCASLCAALMVSAFARTPPTIVPEIVFDDTLPFVGPWPSTYHHSGLGVDSADFDGNGILDVVVGGNGVVPVRIFYLQQAGSGISVKHEEVLEYFTSNDNDPNMRFPNTFGCYGVGVGDFNEDGFPDIVVTRRKGSTRFSPPYNQRDTVWLNDAVQDGPAGVPGQGPYDLFNNAIVTQLNVLPYPNELLATSAASSESFGLKVSNLDGASPTSPAHLDIVIAGQFGVRMYIGDGTGLFPNNPPAPALPAHRATFAELDSSGAWTPGTYRNISLGDVDSDGDTDMFVVRTEGSSDRVWFNMARAPFTGVTDQFAWRDPSLSEPPALLRGQPHFLLRNEIATNQPGYCAPEPNSSFDADLGDLDSDGDLDLVVASPGNDNVAYINNGKGYFGTLNVPPAAAPFYNNGSPKYSFETPTANWPSASGYAQSQFLFLKCDEDTGHLLSHPSSPPAGIWTDYEFHMDGKLLDLTTSCRIADVNGDGVLDVAFANRNDWHEWCLGALIPGGPGGNPAFPYFSASNRAAPVYDYVYYGARLPAGQVGFWPCVEAVGEANDGTAYLEFVNLGGTAPLDWIECNFANEWITDTGGVDRLTPPDEEKPGNINNGTYLLFPHTFPGQRSNMSMIFGQPVGPLSGWCANPQNP